MSQTTSTALDRAIAAFREGRPVLVHDAADREGEVDLVYPASAVTPEAVARMRNDAGGLVCAALTDEVAEAFDLPLLQEALDHQQDEIMEAIQESGLVAVHQIQVPDPRGLAELAAVHLGYGFVLGLVVFYASAV
jgi:3,4-dihydroxy-2-butanone 4-phosphate synthase